MKKVKYLNDGNIYPVDGVLENFPKFFDMTANEMMEMFLRPGLIDESVVRQYIRNNLKITDSEEQEKMVEERMEGSYRVFQIQLAILANKGRIYLLLLQYVANIEDINHKDEFYEDLLKSMGLDHYCKCMTVKHLNKVLLPLFYITEAMKEILKKANCLKIYQQQVYDRLARNFGKEKLYPEDCVVSYRDCDVDKTSFSMNECKVLKKII